MCDRVGVAGQSLGNFTERQMLVVESHNFFGDDLMSRWSGCFADQLATAAIAVGKWYAMCNRPMFEKFCDLRSRASQSLRDDTIQ